MEGGRLFQNMYFSWAVHVDFHIAHEKHLRSCSFLLFLSSLLLGPGLKPLTYLRQPLTHFYDDSDFHYSNMPVLG
jgi:hypothetical protein